MSELKIQRQRAIAQLIRTHSLASQDELAARLTELGFTITQATVSRDLEQLGAVKVRRGGQLSYALPEQVASGGGPRLAAVLPDFVRSVQNAGNLVVVKTPPGSAHLIGVSLDQSDWPEIVGTICGDDTCFVACRESGDAEVVALRLREGPSGQLQ